MFGQGLFHVVFERFIIRGSNDPGLFVFSGAVNVASVVQFAIIR